MSEMKQKQGGNDGDAPRCPPHPGFIDGLCFLRGAKEEDAERGAPGVAVGHETMKQGGDGYGSEDEVLLVKEDDTEGGAPGAAVGHGMMKEEGNDHRNAARCPQHPEFVLGLCYRCKATEEDAGGSSSGVTVPYLDDALMQRAAALTSIVSASDMATLKQERKLILVLDLDHTLLNSTGLQDLSALEQRNGLTIYTDDELRMELFRLDFSNNDVQMLVKLRPFVRRFLDEANPLFEMHVYNLGTQAYAKPIIDLLDPDGVYFGGRVVSRNESILRGMKSLDVIPGADPAAVVILDDTDSVWPENQDNLILMDRYHYFASTCRQFGYDIPSMVEQGRDEREHDGSLFVVLGVLKRIHQAFFDGDRADVREVIAEVRRQVLPECTVVFSYLEEYMEHFPEDTVMWKLAERLGAVCQEDVDETVTHVVAEDPGTQKAQWARDHGKFLVNLEWIGGEFPVVPGRRARVPGDRPCELNGVASCAWLPILQLAVMALLIFVRAIEN